MTRTRFALGQSEGRACIRRLIVMIAVLTLLGVAPMFAVMLVPARLGPVMRVVVSGEDAERLLAAELASKPQQKAVHDRETARLRAKYPGRHRSLTIQRSYREPVQQSLLRRAVDALVPTLQASNREGSAYTAYDDYSEYDENYDGGVYGWDSNTNLAMWLRFDKDPSTNLAQVSFDEFYCWSNNGTCDQIGRNTQPGAVGWLARSVREFLYPSLNAATVNSPLVQSHYWERWAECVLSACTTAAAACFIANVWDAEVFWAPCFVSWCGGAEIGCLVLAYFQIDG